MLWRSARPDRPVPGGVRAARIAHNAEIRIPVRRREPLPCNAKRGRGPAGFLVTDSICVHEMRAIRRVVQTPSRRPVPPNRSAHGRGVNRGWAHSRSGGTEKFPMQGCVPARHRSVELARAGCRRNASVWTCQRWGSPVARSGCCRAGRWEAIQTLKAARADGSRAMLPRRLCNARCRSVRGPIQEYLQDRIQDAARTRGGGPEARKPSGRTAFGAGPAAGAGCATPCRVAGRKARQWNDGSRGEAFPRCAVPGRQ